MALSGRAKYACVALFLPLLISGCAATGTGEEEPGARNVILFLGDGMGVSTVTAARILAGQQQGKPGEEHVLPFETFPNVALIKTYNVDSQVADSAGTMSAIMTGRKTRIGVFGIPPEVDRNDCRAALASELPTLLEEAEDRGFATGIVTTTRITHATPAATYAHVPNRNWEVDMVMPAEAREAGCRDIARQLVEFDHGDGIEVMLGGGRAAFLPATQTDPEYGQVTGMRADGLDLLEAWQAAGENRHFVWNRAQFDRLPETGQVLGLFEPSHMQFEADRNGTPEGEPSIAEMTALAIERLRRAGSEAGSGFFLMVEGGRIDHGHHAGNAYRSLTDAVAMAEAVQVAMDMTAGTDTLILVTADHSHTLTISGYPRRGNPILGKVRSAVSEAPDTDALGRPYTTLGYANGPGYREEPADLTDVDTQDRDFLQPATIPLELETHGGEDVTAYARGPNAEKLRGVMEQNRIYDVLRGALFPGETSRE